MVRTSGTFSAMISIGWPSVSFRFVECRAAASGCASLHLSTGRRGKVSVVSAGGSRARCNARKLPGRSNFQGLVASWCSLSAQCAWELSWKWRRGEGRGGRVRFTASDDVCLRESWGQVS